MNNENRCSGFGFETLSVHAGERPDPITGAIAPALIRTKTYRQPHFAEEAKWQYARGANPTRAILEEKIAVLEGGGFATVFSSGVAAETMLFLTLKPGDHVVLCKEVYGGTYRLLDKVFSKFGIEYDFVDFNSEDAIYTAIRQNTVYLWAETPSNPSLHVIDLTLVRRVSESTGVPFIVDGTFAPPCSTRPFEYGASVVIHSLSKYVAGHNDALAGAIVTKDIDLHHKLQTLQRSVGAVLSPDECYRVIQGIKTLSLRWRRVSETAQIVAEFLSNHPAVERVLYPGLTNHPSHAVAVRQMKNGFGAVVSFEMREKTKDRLRVFVDAVAADGVVVYGESLASPETILAYPPFMSHRSLSVEDRESLGISDGFFRFSVGFEDAVDIVASLERGFTALGQ